MQAVYGFCYEKNPAPPELIIGLDWLRFSTPYRAGGLQDQPLHLLRRMKIALTVCSAVNEWKYKYTPTPESERYWYFMHVETMKIVHKILNWNSDVG